VVLPAEDFRAAMGSFAAGVTVITALDAAGIPQAMTATSFSSLSLDPPLCLVCMDRRARAYVPLLTQGCFGVSILSADQEEISSRFAAPVADRFAGVSWRPGAATGCPMIVGALAFLECHLVEVHAGGDHDILVGRVDTVKVRDGKPLVYWRGRYAGLHSHSAPISVRGHAAPMNDS
jgi:flavin reductase (DIM6/NTAB) family NADH-FMN oxidoreductase RutF